MDHLAPFRIPFVGLKPGQHDFQMEVDSLFFESFPSSETDQITGEAEVTIDKLGSKMDCIVRFSGDAILPCDRCLGDVQIRLSFDERLVVQLGESTNTEEEIWTLGLSAMNWTSASPSSNGCICTCPRADCTHPKTNAILR